MAMLKPFRCPPGVAPVTAILLGPILLTPASGNEEPVAPYVPTVEEDVELMLDVAGVEAGDYVIDLGSGDGRIVIAAGRRGAFGHGVEIEPELVQLSRANARGAGVAERTAFVQGDIFDAPIAEASVVTLYLFPEVNIALRPKLLAELAPGTRVVSNSFDMGDWWPDVHDITARSSGGILLWIVPADVAGGWMIEIEDETRDGEEAERYALHVEQEYQRVDLDFRSTSDGSAGSAWDTADATLRGDRIAFRASRREHSYAFGGRVQGDSMSGYVQIRDGGGERLSRWHALR